MKKSIGNFLDVESDVELLKKRVDYIHSLNQFCEDNIALIKKEVFQVLIKLGITIEGEQFVNGFSSLSTYFPYLLVAPVKEEYEVERIEYCDNRKQTIEEIKSFDKSVLIQVRKSLKHLNKETIESDESKREYLIALPRLLECLLNLSEDRWRAYTAQTSYHFRETEFEAILPYYESRRKQNKEAIEDILTLNRSRKVS